MSKSCLPLLICNTQRTTFLYEDFKTGVFWFGLRLERKCVSMDKYPLCLLSPYKT